MFQNDLEDAYTVISCIAGVEDELDSYGIKVRKNWGKCVAKGEHVIWSYLELQGTRHRTHDRVVPAEFLDNEIIIGKTINGHLIALDGSHRIFQHIEKSTKKIKVFIVDISWMEEAAEDMEF